MLCAPIVCLCFRDIMYLDKENQLILSKPLGMICSVYISLNGLCGPTMCRSAACIPHFFSIQMQYPPPPSCPSYGPSRVALDLTSWHY